MFPKQYRRKSIETDANVFRNEGLKARDEFHNSKQNKSMRYRVKLKAKSFIRLFLETSSIHGLNHFIASRRHPCEVFLWLTVVILSVFGTTYLSWTTWIRYQSSPTVVSMERDMFAWNTTFPSITMCLDMKIDPQKLAKYIKNSDEPDKTKLEEFILTLANATFQTFNSIPEYDRIPADDYMQLILDLAPDFKPGINTGAMGIALSMLPTITEMGLCYSVSSRVAIYNSPWYRASNRWDLVKTENETFYVHPLDGEVFAQLLNISSSYNVYIHGSSEVPDISTKHYHSSENFYMKIYVTAVTVYTSSEATKLTTHLQLSGCCVCLWATGSLTIRLTVSQRRCRFPHENILKHNAVYTYTLCRIECRLRLCLKYCGCVPHFYRKISGEKTCNVEGLRCLANYKDELYKLRDKSGKKMNCTCYPLCDDTNFVIQSNTLQEWFLGTNMQWGIVTYPRMRYRRDIIFGFTDLLVAVGGMAGLFLGCSVLSFMEIVYFITLRLYWYLRGR